VLIRIGLMLFSFATNTIPHTEVWGYESVSFLCVSSPFTFKVNENFTPTNRKVNVKGYSPYFIRAVISTSGTFIAYLSIFSVYPDFAGASPVFPIISSG